MWFLFVIFSRYSSRSNIANHSPDGLVPQISVTEGPTDPVLAYWLSNIGLEQQVIDRIVMEEYTLNDILNDITKSDLERLNLKGEL